MTRTNNRQRPVRSVNPERQALNALKRRVYGATIRPPSDPPTVVTRPKFHTTVVGNLEDFLGAPPTASGLVNITYGQLAARLKAQLGITGVITLAPQRVRAWGSPYANLPPGPTSTQVRDFPLHLIVRDSDGQVVKEITDFSTIASGRSCAGYEYPAQTAMDMLPDNSTAASLGFNGIDKDYRPTWPLIYVDILWSGVV